MRKVRICGHRQNSGHRQLSEIASDCQLTLFPLCYHAEKQDGVTNQRVVIYYNCIGAFDVPDRRKIRSADMITETRKGAALSCAPEQVAV